MSATSERRKATDQNQSATASSRANQEALERQVRQRKAALIVKLDKRTGKKTSEHIVRIAEGKAS